MRKHLYVVFKTRLGDDSARPYYFETAMEAHKFSEFFSYTSLPRRTTSTASKAERLLEVTKNELEYLKYGEV